MSLVASVALVIISGCTEPPEAVSIATLFPAPTPRTIPDAPVIVEVVPDEFGLGYENAALELESLVLSQTSWFSGPVYIGFVVNNGPETLPGVSVTFRYRNEARQLEVAAGSASMMLTGELGPGEWVPFVETLPAPEQGEWDSVHVSLSVNSIGAFFGRRVEGLEVSEIEPQSSGVSGTIYNGSDREVGGTGLMEGLAVAVIGYDEEDQVVAVAQTTIHRILEPGWSTSFEIGELLGLGLWGQPSLAVHYEARVLERRSSN